MYRKVENAPREAEDFELPFEGKLSQDNRWIIMASLVPWEEFEEEYAQNFSRLLGVNLVNRINERMVIHSQSESQSEPKKKVQKRKGFQKRGQGIEAN